MVSMVSKICVFGTFSRIFQPLTRTFPMKPIHLNQTNLYKRSTIKNKGNY